MNTLHEIEQWKAELSAAGWKQTDVQVLKSPSGASYRGPFGAWRKMKEQRLAPTIPDWLFRYVQQQQTWSAETFGPGRRTLGITAHIRKELAEIEADPDDVREWIDVIILAMDGYWRHGGKPEELAEMLEAKQRVNFERAWPAVKPEDQPMEHLK